MRKYLPLFLPAFILLVIGGAFFVLSSHKDDSSILGIRSADASHVSRYRKERTRRTVTPLPTATPTLKLRPTSTPTPTPTRLPTNTPTPTPPKAAPTSTPTPTPQQSSTTSEVSLTSVQSYILGKINDYRSSQGLSPVKADTYTCDFAALRANEIKSSFNHDGFTNRINAKTLPYPTYHEVTENIAMTSNYQDVVTMWINSPGHAENMRKDTPYVCVAQSGNYYAYEGWRP